MLESWVLECDVAADGPRALGFARSHRYDAVLCDWRLPGELSGGDTRAALAPLQPRAKIQVLMTDERDDAIARLPAGVPVLRKPVRPIRLRALLSAHLQPSA